MGKAPKTLKIVIYPPLQEYNFLKYLLSLAYVLWALDILIFSVTPFIMETKANVNLWSLVAIVKTLETGILKRTTALDFCQEYLS